MRPAALAATRLTPQPDVRPAPRGRIVGRRVVVVVNANASGAGAAADVMARATHELRAVGAQVDARLTGDEHELAEAVREAAGRTVVVVGGDGTVHALANLDLAHPPPAALLPAGRANNIARALGIPVDWRAAARLAIWGRTTPVDVLKVATPERTLFAVEGVSAGFHAAARHRYNGTNSADIAAGVRALVGELRAFRPFPAALRVDGATFVDRPVAQAFVSNLPFFGFGFQVDPVADWSDGRAEAIVLDAQSRRNVVRLLGAARNGRHLQRDGVMWRRGREARFDMPLPLVADAQPLGVTTATVTVEQGRLRLAAPGAA